MTHCDTQWTAAWLHYAVCSSFSFICNRSENPEHSWGYQTVLLCYLLCGRSESRLGAQVSMQKSVQFCFYRLRIHLCIWEEIQVSSHLSWVLLSASVNSSHMKPVREWGGGGAGPSCCLPCGTESPVPWDVVRACCFRTLPTSWMGAASFPESVLRSDANITWDWQDLKEASTMGSEIPSLEVCLSRSHSSQELGQVGTSS